MARHIVIVGGGAAGALTAIHLARQAGSQTRISIVEPRARLAEGVAYGTRDDSHLLNVPAAGMSAFDDVPGDFAAWSGAAADDFLPRHRYAEYLRHVLTASTTSRPHVVFEHHRARVGIVDVAPLRVVAEDGTTLTPDAVVLALGNAPPVQPEWVQHVSTMPVIVDPWVDGVLDTIETGTRVLCVGTGLTFVDVALSLARRDIHVTGVSRHGLLPTVHSSIGSIPALPDEFTSVVDVSRWIRSQHDWRAAFAALRPATQRLWRTLDTRQQSQFLRHARRYWDVHRHRMSASVAEQFDQHRRGGHIVVMRGDAKTFADTGSFDTIILCTGPDDSTWLTAAPLAALAAAGVVAAGPHGMGIAADADTRQVCDQQGRLIDGLFAVGPLRRGSLWESTAIPEIRSEAQRLAALLLA